MSISSWNILKNYAIHHFPELSSHNNLYSFANHKGFQKNWMFLIYMFSNPYSPRSKMILNQRYENLITNRNILNTSFFSNTHCYAIAHTIGYILDVPPQNIISTNSHDIEFPNDIGTPGDLLQGVNDVSMSRLPSSYQMAEYIKRHVNKNIVSPQILLSSTVPNTHNEVLVVAKPNVHIHTGYPPTAMVRVKAVIMIHEKLYQDGTPMAVVENQKMEEMIGLVKHTANINNVPAIFVSAGGQR